MVKKELTKVCNGDDMKKTIFVLTASLFAVSAYAQYFSAPAATSDRTVDPNRVNQERATSPEPAPTVLPPNYPLTPPAATSVPGAVHTLPSPNANRPLAPQPNQQPAPSQMTDRPVEPGRPTIIQTPAPPANQPPPSNSISDPKAPKK